MSLSKNWLIGLVILVGSLGLGACGSQPSVEETSGASSIVQGKADDTEITDAEAATLNCKVDTQALGYETYSEQLGYSPNQVSIVAYQDNDQVVATVTIKDKANRKVLELNNQLVNVMTFQGSPKRLQVGYQRGDRVLIDIQKNNDALNGKMNILTDQELTTKFNISCEMQNKPSKPEEPSLCPSYYSPVCGADGKTYMNKCYADTANVEIAYGGECNTADPTPELCTEVYQPVCGTDGYTYSNECYARQAGVKVATEGPCAGDNGGSTIQPLQ